MIEALIVLSDIHGNLSALESVIKDIQARHYTTKYIAILGDNINYGMRPNEVIWRLQEFAERYEVIVNLFGNHEKALIDKDTTYFSTDRGRRVLDYTRRQLKPESMNYINTLTKEGFSELEISGKKILFIHGSYEDPYWGKLNSGSVDNESYAKYDFVISGHTHVPHLIEHFFSADNPEYRDKKRTVFLNPGSVGQPRNHNPRAQYLYIDLNSEIFHFNSVCYDIETERSLFTEQVDLFYSERLINGI